ncbi:MAG: hypothetical protein EOM23_06565, partial [Candidatus Moranbacteria bacterium]|nr:hypothetical protein [Candidatus Moranbacteria bacterium]
MSVQNKIRLKFALFFILAVFSVLVAYPKSVQFIPPLYEVLNKPQVALGLDLQGGYRLEYEVDDSKIENDKKEDALQAAQDVLERKVNATGTSEALIQSVPGNPPRIIVEYPGAEAANELKDKIKETPFLEFKEEKNEEEQQVEIEKYNSMFASSNEQAKATAQEKIDKIKSGTSYEALVEELNNDLTAGGRKEELGFVKKDMLPEPINEAVFVKGINNGEVYPELLETDFGWHILKKLEERGEGDEKEVNLEHIVFAKQTAEMYR